MTYAETAKLVAAINEIETWTRAIQREEQKAFGETDFDQIAKYSEWLGEAKQSVFEIASRAK